MELEHFVTRRSVEEAYRHVRQAQQVGRDSIAAQGWRAAKARNSKLLLALQGGAQILQKMSEEQHGVHGLDIGGLRVPATEFQLWRNAYTGADAGTPEQNYSWIYAAAGILAGVVIP